MVMQMSLKERQCVIPERCARCGAVFDLWYDLFKREEELEKEVNDFLCWKCRAAEVGEQEEMGAEGWEIDEQVFDEIEDSRLNI